MTRRNAQLQAFLDTMHMAICDRARTGPARQTAAAAFGALAQPGEVTPSSPGRLAVCAQLSAALDLASRGSASVARHAMALASLEPQLTWYRRPGAAGSSEPFASGHANATVIGRGGLETSEHVRIGVSLLGPDITYPDHRHPPEEVYLVLSAGAWRQSDGDWHKPGIGGIVYNPPDIMHAMRSGPVPLLATWCLWAGPA